MNEALVQVANLANKNLYSQAIHGNLKLKNRLDFQSQITTKTKDNTVTAFTIQDFQKLVRIHDTAENSSKFACMALVQCMLGQRFKECCFTQGSYEFHLSPHSRQQTHDSEKTCIVPTLDCFHHVIFPTTKTGKIKVSIPPAVWSCVCFLRSSPVKYNAYSNSKYNQWLATTFGNENLSSHDLRRFLPNFTMLSSMSRNTASWRSSGTMSNHYLTLQTKQVDVLTNFFTLKNRSVNSCCSDFKTVIKNHF